MKKTISSIQMSEVTYIIQQEDESTQYPWTENNLQGAIKAKLQARKLCHQNKILGYCVYQLMEETAEIQNFVIFNAYQNQGLGKNFLEKLIVEIKSSAANTLWLEVRESNKSAIKLYAAVGFVQSGLRKNYYKSNNSDKGKDAKENALLMQCKLKRH